MSVYADCIKELCIWGAREFEASPISPEASLLPLWDGLGGDMTFSVSKLS